MKPRTFSLVIAFSCLTCALLAQTAPATQPATKTVQERMGYPASTRLLIIHSDDLGMNHSVNRATFEALEKGWITSASILVPCPWLPEVAHWTKQHPDADLGIHLALTSEWTDFRWGPVASKNTVSTMLDPEGYLPLDTPEVGKNAAIPEVKTELHAQINRARSLGITLTHLDMHMVGMVSTPELFKVYEELRDEYKLSILLEPVGAHAPPSGVMVPATAFSVDRVIDMEPGIDAKNWLDWYKQQLAPLGPGVYQLIVHLAYDDEEMRGATWNHPDWGAAWRQHDLDMVKGPEFRQFLKDQGFVLVRWKDLSKALPANYGK